MKCQSAVAKFRIKNFGQLCVLTLTVLWLNNCTQPMQPIQAESLIRASNFMREPATTKLVLFRNQLLPKDDLLSEHPDLQPFVDKGLVVVRPNTVVLGQSIGAVCALTPEGEREAAADKWVQATGPNGEDAWLVVTARKEFVLVTEPKAAESLAECHFQWRWKPTKIGKVIGKVDSGLKTSSARFLLANGQWHLDEESVR